MTILSPLWLMLGLAVAVPIAVHLWNRKSGDPFLLGTFRFLPDDSFSKAKNIDLHEIPLLLVRILIVLIITLLVAQLFWTYENEPVHTVLITEVVGESDQVESNNNTDGILEIELSSEKIAEYKWWNLISQVDGDYQPDVIIAEGEFSRNRMGNVRQRVSAEVQWIEREPSKNKSSKIWSSGDEILSALVAEKVNGGVQYAVQELTDTEILDSGEVDVDADTVQFFGPIRMVIDEGAPASIQDGLKYTADHWNIEHEIGSVDGLMSIEMGEENCVLQKSEFEGNKPEWIEANRMTSIGINVRVKDTANIDDVFFKTRTSNSPVFGKIDSYTFLVNGDVERDLESWFYAGVGHQMFKNILGVDEAISPTISEKERMLNIREAGLPYRGTESTPARLWLVGLLLVLWLTERIMAPARGM